MTTKKPLKDSCQHTKKDGTKTKEISLPNKNNTLQTQSEIKNMKNFFSTALTNFTDDERFLKEYIELKRIKNKTKEQENRESKLVQELLALHGLDNGIWTATLSRSQYYGALSKMRQDIVKKYNCKTPIELMLADRIVASYWRAMKCDMIFNHLVEKEDGSFSFDQLKVNVIKEFNKGIELANRQLNANIILLKELKQPQLNVRVKTDSAYIARNQQVNINPPDKTNTNNENIKPN